MNRSKTLIANSLLSPVPASAVTPILSSASTPLPPSLSSTTLQPVKTPPTGRCLRLTDHQRRVLLGPIVTVIGSLLLVTMTQCLRQTTSSPRFHAPFFVAYVTSVWTTAIFPCRLLVKFTRVRGRLSLKETFRESFHDYDEHGLTATVFKVASKCAGFCLLWTLTNYLYIRALDYISLIDCCSLGSVHSNFIYPLSWIILKKNFVPVRIIALILAMAGIILMLHSDVIFGSRGMLGSVLAVASTFCSAVYKVVFRQVFGDITTDQMSLSISFIGLIHLLTMWIPVLVLYLTSLESIHPDAIPWLHLLGAAVFAIAFNCLLTFGIALTYPVFLHASFLLAMPFSIVVVMVLSGDRLSIGGMQLSAYAFFVVAFILNLLPDKIQDFISNIVHFRPDSKDSTSPAMTLTDHTTNASTPRSVIRISPATPGTHNA